MADRIRILEASLAAKIAAGEVVDRPASVVKELIENSIDAGAKSIAVFIVEGGKRLIRVVDDGVGMSRRDAQAAFQRHATSKVSCEEDLERIETLGFRGEALASIAAVSRVRLRTKERGALAGVSVIVEGGGEARLDDDGAPEGASVEVKDIFYNLPARLKFLRSADSEYGRVLDVFKKAALINPGISFSLMHGSSSSRGIYAASGTLAERVAALFPEYKSTDFTEARSPVVNGLIANHEVSFSTTKCLYVYVNKRPVKDRSINSAILDGYGTILDRGRYPFAVLDITMAPEDVDVNIHPAKTEVRFKSQRYVYDSVKAAVRRALGMEVGVVSQTWQARPADLRPSNPVVYYGEGRNSSQKNFYANEPDAGYGVEQRLIQRDVADTADAGFATDVKAPELAGLRPVGQIWGEFLVAESPDGYFFIIDQHGAEERCAYERLKKLYMGGGDFKRQMLLLPERFEATPEECEAISHASGELLKLGFEVIPFGPSPGGAGESFLVKSVPDILAGKRADSLIKDLSAEIVRAGGSRRAECRIEDALMRIACHSVIRGARALAPQEAQALLTKLARVDFSGYCPHGRPVVKKFTRKDIEAMFKR